MDNTITVDQAWDKLIDLGISEQTLRTVTNINGYNLDTLQDVLYSDFGYRSFEQFENEDSND